YVRTHSTSVKNALIPRNMEAYERKGAKGRLDIAHPTSAGDWRWLQLKPPTFEQIGPRPRLDARADASLGQKVKIDSIVISTNADLDDATLENTPSLFSAGPMARVNEMTSTIDIDGRSDDAAWKSAVAIEDLVTYKALRPASQPTS